MSFPLNTPEERKEAARWAYRLLLDREAESPIILEQVQKTDTASLRESFVASSEYADHVGRNLSRPVRIVGVDAPANQVEIEMSRDLSEKLRAHVQATWTLLGEEAPHWSVLSSEEFRPQNIADNEASFYGSGEQDLNTLLGVLARQEIKPKDLPVCFEFGCGLGRVTLPLAETFKRVIACDISASHLAVARRRAKDAGHGNITFTQADTGDFGVHEGFDLWFSRIVLQHNPPPIMHAVLDRALGKLNRGGVAVFQIPTHATGYRFDVRKYVQQLGETREIEMHCLPQRHVFELARKHGLHVLEVREDFSAGPHEHWVSNVFTLRRPK